MKTSLCGVALAVALCSVSSSFRTKIATLLLIYCSHKDKFMPALYEEAHFIKRWLVLMTDGAAPHTIVHVMDYIPVNNEKSKNDVIPRSMRN